MQEEIEKYKIFSIILKNIKDGNSIKFKNNIFCGTINNVNYEISFHKERRLISNKYFAEIKVSEEKFNLMISKEEYKELGEK